MTNQIAKDFERKCIETMGDRLGAQYYTLWHDVAVLESNWKEYIELFGGKPQGLEMLDQAARTFFYAAQNEGLAACLLALARLTGPPRSGGRENLTIRNLPTLIDDPYTKEKVEELIEIALNATKFCRDWRHRHIAQDYTSRSFKGRFDRLPRNMSKVNDALKAIADVLSAIERQYMNAVTPSA